MRLHAAAFALLLPLAAACSDDGGDDTDVSVDVGDTTDAADTADVSVDTDASADVPDAVEDTVDGSGDTTDTDLPDVPTANPYPAPDAWPSNHGPGGPVASFTEEELYQNCAFLDGGDLDTTDHHNLLVMTDGYLLMPWAPEWGRGGLTFFDITDPCAPTVAGTGYSDFMRETHSIGFANIDGRKFAVVNGINPNRLLQPGGAGIQFWDITDPTEPFAIGYTLEDETEVEFFGLPGAMYPDAYARVPLAVFYQAPYVYVASSDNGIHVVDATDPTAPEFVTQFTFDPILRAGQVHAIGNLLVVTAAEGPQTALMDISDPRDPQLITTFLTEDTTGVARENYFSNVQGGYSWYARKSSGGGLFAYDITDPQNPVKAGEFHSLGNGGYIFVKDELAFVGESSSAAIYDVSDLSNVTQVTRMDLEGDLDTVTPIGNIAVLSVDDEANPNEGTAMAPYATEPDTRPPAVNWVYPDDGSVDLPVTSRIGLSFNEMVDPGSAWEGSIRLYETGTEPADTRVDGYISTQEALVNFSPREPLQPGTEYTLEVPAGGVVDFNGNAVEETFTMTFTTAE